MDKHIIGERKCIDGKQYQYFPASEENLAGTETAGEASLTAALQDMSTYMIAMAQYVIAELSYQGLYRSATLTVKKTTTNQEFELLFPARSFRLSCASPIILRIGNTGNDPINISNSNSPFNLDGLSAGLAFTKFYITNNNTVDVDFQLFAMG